MENKDYSKFTDQELQDEAKKMKTDSFINAVLIGFMMGIVVFSIIKNSFGFLMLIPLYVANRLVKNSKSKNAQELDKILKERNLKNE